MDFLDPKKTRRHTILLFTGYLLIGIMIAISTLVLIYQANGFGVNNKGQVVQSGLVFVSSAPNPAKIYLNDKLYGSQTNVRLSLPAGTYKLRLSRDGYRDWDRTITVMGGDVQNFDYPMLFPKTLETKTQHTYDTAPGLTTQSRDRRWLLVQQSATSLTFDMYDLKTNPLADAEQVSLPTNVATVPVAGTAQTWTAVQWANDAQHVLLKHTYGTASEYIIMDRSDPAKSVNLNKDFGGITPTDLTLIDNKYDQYYFLSADGTLSRATLDAPTPTTVLENVINYKSYSSSELLYVTAADAPDGKVNVMLYNNKKTYTVRQVAANTTYQLDIAEYSNAQYVTLAVASEGTVYIYKDPLDQLRDPSVTKPSALRALHVPDVSYLSFSPSTRYIIGESNGKVALYDIYLKLVYSYSLAAPIDAPQAHVSWMDGDRLTYVSNGKTVVVDHDNRNQQTLMATDPVSGSLFDQRYYYEYSLVHGDDNAVQLQRTGLRTANDL